MKMVQRWSVSYKFTNGDVIKIKNEPGYFLADPFLSGIILYAEEYSYKTGKGHIVAYKLYKDAYYRIGVALCQDYHLSFPSLFYSGCDLFMLPEAHESGKLTLYKNTGGACDWTEYKTIADGNYIDSFITEIDGEKYLFANKINENKLFVYRLNQEYGIMDSVGEYGGADYRNGGFYYKGENFIRIGQMNCKQIYGYNYNTKKVIIDENGYKEEYLKTINPPEGCVGTHHYVNDGLISAWDTCIYVNLEDMQL